MKWLAAVLACYGSWMGLLMCVVHIAQTIVAKEPYPRASLLFAPVFLFVAILFTTLIVFALVRLELQPPAVEVSVPTGNPGVEK